MLRRSPGDMLWSSSSLLRYQVKVALCMFPSLLLMSDQRWSLSPAGLAHWKHGYKCRSQRKPPHVQAGGGWRWWRGEECSHHSIFPEDFCARLRPNYWRLLPEAHRNRWPVGNPWWWASHSHGSFSILAEYWHRYTSMSSTAYCTFVSLPCCGLPGILLPALLWAAVTDLQQSFLFQFCAEMFFEEHENLVCFLCVCRSFLWWFSGYLDLWYIGSLQNDKGVPIPVLCI